MKEEWTARPAVRGSLETPRLTDGVKWHPQPAACCQKLAAVGPTWPVTLPLVRPSSSNSTMRAACATCRGSAHRNFPPRARKSAGPAHRLHRHRPSQHKARRLPCHTAHAVPNGHDFDALPSFRCRRDHPNRTAPSSGSDLALTRQAQPEASRGVPRERHHARDRIPLTLRE